ncbi:serine hydrolase domain-containing protein [Microbulbifer sp. TYP-18]|uniref:serine hydrolase domain-containing protein n=1 Tax=Microbulbifer sp. TYP-18 TaxID=3230024 RepID=UPI0034C67203
MKINLIHNSLIASITLFCIASIAESGSKSAPEISEFDVNNLSYSFEQTLPDLDNAYIDSNPSATTDGITVGGLLSGGNSRDSIIALARELGRDKHGDYDSLLISHKDKLVFESYYKKGRLNLPHFQASVTKSYLSIAIGRAVQLGYLTMADLDKPIGYFFQELKPDQLLDGAENITLNHLMSMRSGIRLNDEKLRLIMDNSSKTKGYNIVQGLLKYSAAITPQSQTFSYQDSDPRITMQILDRVVPGTAEDFIRDEVLAKLGITVYGWRNDINGLPIAESGSSIRSRDMLKLGRLVNNSGQWNGEQLISAEFLTKATSNITKPTEDWIPDTFNYGYFWYQMDLPITDKTYTVNLAWRAGGQRIIAVKKLDLVVVITGHDREDKIMNEVSTRVLPVFAKP